ncbi:fimbrial protein TcfA [Burkholderia lata]|uniref:Giant cable pilus chaperone protein n=1 Tax=Burkholderia lata (strain ATCC 17760 / DSM 23089 / LMG 22485 / NCIMB 9086 / R18194 / 383) TaxID=482957 RepID=A0A6P2SAI1_BURL3|nr:fimbrial protein TcfA [Burkholderia lata]VWC47155.1 giant cable pilus chaperone protein [Burkholderia lata]
MLLATVLSVLSTDGIANMLVYPMSTTIGRDGGSTAQLRVYSKSEATQYVKVGIKRVVDPATPHEHEVAVSRVGSDAVTVSPSKFVLAAGGSRLVRVIPLGTPHKEALYRVYLQPVPAPAEEAAAASDTQGNLAGQVDFSLIWAPLIHIMPKVSDPALSVSHGRLVNTGNVRVGVLETGECRLEEDASSCRWNKVERSVYPDQHIEIKNTSQAPYLRIRYRADGAKGEQQRVFPSRSDDTTRASGASIVPSEGHPVTSIN